MDLNDLFDDASDSEWADLPELGATATLTAGIKSPFSIVGNVTAAASNAATLALAVRKAMQAGATPAQIATLKRSPPKAIANIAKASIPQIQKLMRMSPTQIANLKKMTAAQAARLRTATPTQVMALKRATPAQLARLRTATPQQMALLRLSKATPAQRAALARATPSQLARLRSATPAQRAGLARMAAMRARVLPINRTAPAAYRQLACTAGVGGEAGLAMLKHIRAQVDLANTRALATSEHNTINNTQAFRRAVLKGLRQRQRACR